MTHASLFSGIGGPEVAAAMMGWNNVFHCEINPFGRQVLEYWFPNSDSYEDITKTDFTKYRGRIDVLTGGFPCQPFSYAGKRGGQTDERYLWPEMLRVIDEVRPTWVIGENVAGITTMVESCEIADLGSEASLFEENNGVHRFRSEHTFTIERICRDLESKGYAVQPMLIPACAVGAPHRRDRVFFIAHNNFASDSDCDRGGEIHKHIQSEFSRGCPNKCKWCVVPRKEGGIRPYMDIDQIATPQRTNVVLMDNNILAAGDYAKEQLRKIIDRGYKVDFNQALDARLVTEEFAELLAQIKWINCMIRFGCDTPGQIKDCERAMKMINSHGYTGQYFLYTMLNDNFKECYERINYWWKKNQALIAEHHKSRVYPYAQPYRDPYNPGRPIPQWQKYMANWVNKKMLFEKISFEEFEPRKGFKCKEYLK